VNKHEGVEVRLPALFTATLGGRSFTTRPFRPHWLGSRAAADVLGNHKKRANTLRGQNVAILYVKMGGTYSYHQVSQSWPCHTSTVQQLDTGITASLPTAQSLTRVVRKPVFIRSVPCLSGTAIFHTTSPLTTVKVRPLSPFSYLAEWQTQHKAALQELQRHHGIRPDATDHMVHFPYGHLNTAIPRLLLGYALCPRGC